MNIPETYIVQKLFSYAHDPTFHNYTKQYNAGCPVCREGRHLGRKKRLYYYTKTNSFFCFNCNKSWTAYTWLKEACKLTYREIQEDLVNGNYRVDITDRLSTVEKYKTNDESLPFDCINLTDQSQLAYYQNDEYVQKALELIKKRRLDTAINRPTSFYISLSDYIHKNRLCIPFCTDTKAISFYQTRCLDNTHPKYLNKLHAEKSLYGINSIDSSLDYIFIFEGPIDAMFVKNGVAVTGLNLTSKQEQELNKYSFHKKIWVLDNQNIDKAAKEKTEKLLSINSSVFIWPENIKCKDFNELAVLLNQDTISHKFILNNTKLF